MKKTASPILAAGLLALSLAFPAYADAVAVTPKQVGDIQYITGGIGDEERTSIEAVKKDYNLHVTSAATSGAFVGNTQISILDSNNQPLLTSETGPLFYAKLPDGTYTVEATHNQQTKSEKIKAIANKPISVVFSWK